MVSVRYKQPAIGIRSIIATIDDQLDWFRSSSTLAGLMRFQCICTILNANP